jgi:hypothetical protein
MSLGKRGAFMRSARVNLPAAAALSLASAAHGGEPAAGPAPPAHLPRFIWECEAATGANSNTCSVWIWHGSSYSATWSIGAMGQLTVPNGDNASELRVRRVDTSGTLAGLDATYTGKWDGTHFTAGSARYSIADRQGRSRRSLLMGRKGHDRTWNRSYDLQSDYQDNVRSPQPTPSRDGRSGQEQLRATRDYSCDCTRV